MDDHPFPIRPVGFDELTGFHAVDVEAFNSPYPTEPERERLARTFEPDRSLAAFDGELIVGTAASFGFPMALPGGVRPVAGIMSVSVLPSHRRRGILRALVIRQLHDLHARREPVAALYASESAIYGRFGYGPASRQVAFTIRRGEGRFVADAPDDPRLRARLATPADVRDELATVYDSVLPGRPGRLRPGRPVVAGGAGRPGVPAGRLQPAALRPRRGRHRAAGIRAVRREAGVA